jgi:hypothetical protein
MKHRKMKVTVEIYCKRTDESLQRNIGRGKEY